MAVELNITHKTTKAPNDILYASDWNEKHWGIISGGTAVEYMAKWFPFEYSAKIQGTWGWDFNGSQLLYLVFHNEPPGQDDEIQYKFSNKAGSYKLYIYCLTASYCGIITVYLDTVNQGDIDTYSAGTQNNVKFSLPITITTDGTHTLDFKIHDKNASSSNYEVQLTYIWITD